MKRKISKQSSLYNSVGLFSLSIPQLVEGSNPPDVSSAIIPAQQLALTAAKEEEAEVVAPSAAATPPQPENAFILQLRQRQERDDADRRAQARLHDAARLQRPYFTAASSGEFSDVLHGHDFHIGLLRQPNSRAAVVPTGASALVSDADFVALSFQALQGVESFIYRDEDVPALLACVPSSSSFCRRDFITLGRSATTLAHYQRHLGVSFAARVLLARAEDAVSRRCQDRGQLALGAAVGDLLRVHDATLSTMHERLVRDGKLCPAQLWAATALHRASLAVLLRAVATPGLRWALDGVGDEAARATVVRRHLKPDAWAAPECTSGWGILDALLTMLDNERTLASLTMPTVSGANSVAVDMPPVDDASIALTERTARLVILSYLARKVSEPLLEQVRCRLFAVRTDVDTLFSERDDEVMAGLPVSAVHLWGPDALPSTSRWSAGAGGPARPPGGSSFAVSRLLASLVWARGPVRLIVGDRPAEHNATTAAPLVTFDGALRAQVGLVNDEERRKSGRDRDMPGPAASQLSPAAGWTQFAVTMESVLAAGAHAPDAEIYALSVQAILAACRDGNASLSLPLHAQDVQATEPLVAAAELRHRAMREAVLGLLDDWAAPAAPAGLGLDDAGAAGGAAPSSSTAAPRPTLVPADDDSTPAAAVAMEVDDADDVADAPVPAASALLRQVPEEPAPESLDTSYITRLGATRTVPRKLMEDARVSLLRRFVDMMSVVEKKQEAMRWAQNRVKSIRSNRRKLVAMMNAERVAWARELMALEEGRRVAVAADDLVLAKAPAYDRTSVRVQQTPGGTSTLSLADGSSSAADVAPVSVSVTSVVAGVSGESADRGDKPSVRVQQTPGGTSTLSLADGSTTSGGLPEVAKSEPTINSKDLPAAVELRPAAGFRPAPPPMRVQVVRAPPVRPTPGRPPVPAPVPAPAPSVSPALAATAAAERPAEAAQTPGQRRTDLSALGAQLVAPDAASLEADLRLRDVAFSSFSEALLALASAHRLVFGPPDGTDGGRMGLRDLSRQGSAHPHAAEAVLLLAQPSGALMETTLAAAVRWQCRVLDQAALFAALINPGTGARYSDRYGTDGIGGGVNGGGRGVVRGGLLWHLDRFEDAFFLSSRSDAVSLLSAALVENHLRRHPCRHGARLPAGSDAGQGRIGASTDAPQPPWNAAALEAAVHTVSVLLGSSEPSFATCAKYTLRPARDPAARSAAAAADLHALGAVAAEEAVFSCSGLSHVEAEYACPWPFAAVITPAVCRAAARTTRRLLALGQCAALLRFVWGDLHGRKESPADIVRRRPPPKQKAGAVRVPPASTAVPSARRRPPTAAPRECFLALRMVQQALSPLSDFTADRVRAHQIAFREGLRDASEHGLAGAAHAVDRYAPQGAWTAVHHTLTPLFSFLRMCRYVCRMAAAVFADEVGEERDEEHEESEAAGAAGSGPARAVPRAVAALLGACRRTLLALEQCNASLALRVDADHGDEEATVTEYQARLRDALKALAAQRAHFLAAVRRATEQEDHRDAAVLLMFFGET